MIRFSWRALVACGLAIVSGAGQAAIKNNYLPPEAHAVDGGRGLLILVPQAEIQPNINISNMTAAMGGGLLFALIDAGINNARAKEAEKQVIPLRGSLVGFEPDPHIQYASTSTLEGLGWFDTRTTKFSKDPSQDAITATLDSGTTPQLMVMRYDYETNADFSAIVVSLHASLVDKKIPKGKKRVARLQPKYLRYNQAFRSFILLPGANPKDPAANVQAWSADGARAARAAIDLGIERCNALLARSLSYSAADAGKLVKRNKRKMSTVPGVTGWIVESQPTHKVYFEALSNSITQVETYAAAPSDGPAMPPAPTPAVAPATAPAVPEAPPAPAAAQ